MLLSVMPMAVIVALMFARPNVSTITRVRELSECHSISCIATVSVSSPTSVLPGQLDRGRVAGRRPRIGEGPGSGFHLAEGVQAGRRLDGAGGLEGEGLILLRQHGAAELAQVQPLRAVGGREKRRDPSRDVRLGGEAQHASPFGRRDARAPAGDDRMALTCGRRVARHGFEGEALRGAAASGPTSGPPPARMLARASPLTSTITTQSSAVSDGAPGAHTTASRVWPGETS